MDRNRWSSSIGNPGRHAPERAWQRVVAPDILMNSQKSTQDRLYDNNFRATFLTLLAKQQLA